MRRRDALKSGIAGAALAMPRLARAAGVSALVFAPQAGLAQLDPTWAMACVARETPCALSTRLNATFVSLLMV